jgi:hypothetical protein
LSTGKLTLRIAFNKTNPTTQYTLTQMLRYAFVTVLLLSLISGSISYRDELTEVLPFDRCVRIRIEDINFMCQPFFESMYRSHDPYDFVNAPRYFSVPANTSFREQVQLAKLKTEGIKALGVPCRDWILHFTCAGIFKPCANVSFVNPLDNQIYYVNTTIVRAPCLDLCEGVYKKCPGAILGDDFPSCNDTTETPLGPVQNFPERGLELPLGFPGQNFTLIPCWRLGDRSAAIREFPCPDPMIFNKDNRPELPECAVACPPPIYTQYQFDFLVISQFVLCLFSIPCCIYVIIPFFCDPRLREFPKCIRGHIAIGNLLTLISRCYVISIDTFCRDETTVMTQSDSICAYNYYANNFGALVSFYCWAALAATLALTLWKAIKAVGPKVYAYNQKVGYGFLIVAWVVSAVQSSLPMAFGEVDGITGYSCGATFWWNMACLVIPMMLCILVATFSAVPIAYCLWKIRFGNNMYKSSTTEAERKKWNYHLKRFSSDLRIFGFIIYLEIVAGLTLATVFAFYVHSDDIEDGLKAWINCSIAFGENCSDLRYDIDFAWTLLAAVQVVSTCKGIPLILLLGSTMEVTKFYRSCWKEGFWSVVGRKVIGSSSQDTPSAHNRTAAGSSQAKVEASASPQTNNSKSSTSSV